MRQFFVIFFGVLTLLSAVLWIIGTLSAAILPWFGGIPMERAGVFATVIFICGDLLACGFAWLRWLLSREQQQKQDKIKLRGFGE